MAKTPSKEPVALPLFDRLLQGDNIETDINVDRAIRVLRESIRRDLETLFNTRPRYLALPEGLNELQSSLVAFGLPDLQIQQMASATQQEVFRRRLEAVVRRFEPRLRELSVEIVKGDEQARDRTLRFRINAVLDVASTSEIVIYDTVVDPVSGALSFAGGTTTV